MATAKVFRSGNSQAVRIPREFQFDTDEVEIERRGNEIILRRPDRNLRGAFDALAALPDDFFAKGREDSLPRASPGVGRRGCPPPRSAPSRRRGTTRRRSKAGS